MKPRRSAIPAAKLGAQLATRLEEAIRANGWGPDHYLGAEEELSARFGASRTVVREAIAIAEWNGTVARRRGREGGVFVAPFAPDLAAGVLRNFLFLAGAGMPALLRARRQVEGAILDRAIERIGADDAAALARLLPAAGAEDWVNDSTRLDQLKSIVEQLARIAGSPVLGMFGMALRHCYVDRVRTTTTQDSAYFEASREVVRLRLQQIEAILACDRLGAHDLQARAMAVWSAFASALPAKALPGDAIVERLADPRHDALIYEFVRPVKKSEALARAVAQTIADRELAPGRQLGTEQALIAQFGVSRRVLREGLRVLEHCGAVGAERGARGGLVVARPQRESLATLLNRADAPVRDDAALVLVPELMADAAAAVVAAGPAARIALAASAQGGDAGTVAWCLAEETPDVVAGCFLAVLLPLVTHPGPGAAQPADLLNAIATGDGHAAPRLAYHLLGSRRTAR